VFGKEEVMDQNNSKIMTVSFVVAGFLAGVVVKVLMDTLAGFASWAVQMNSIEAVKHGLPLTVGFLTFIFLQFNPKIRVWAEESIVELRKVVWPTFKDTRAMTIVVCVMLVIASLILGLFDVVSGHLVKLILS
jgi:preprotein translocase subunit SecE